MLSLDHAYPSLVLFLTALIITLLMVPVARRIAWRLDAVDKPGARRINRTAIPRMGGIAVFVGMFAAMAIRHFGSSWFGWPVVLSPSPHLSLDYRLLTLSFILIFLTGFLDDKFQLSPLQKLGGQIAAATIACAAGLVIGTIINPITNSSIELGWWGYPITVGYLVAYVNIFNLIDGLDGLASGIAAIASFTMFVLSSNAGRPDAAALSLATCGACMGFLRYNFHPASIFLGDSGSLLLGFSLGCASLLSVTRVAGLTTIIVPLVIAGIPIIDTFSAIIRRSRAHVSIGQADRGHIHHRLIDEGFNQRQAVLIMYAWTTALCLGTFAMTQVDVLPRVIIFILLVATSALLARKLHLTRPVLLHHYNPRTGKDELVTPDDPAFSAEEERLEKQQRL